MVERKKKVYINTLNIKKLGQVLLTFFNFNLGKYISRLKLRFFLVGTLRILYTYPAKLIKYVYIIKRTSARFRQHLSYKKESVRE